MLTLLLVFCVVSFATFIFTCIIEFFDLENWVPFIDIHALQPHSLVALIFFIVASCAWAFILFLLNY